MGRLTPAEIAAIAVFPVDRVRRVDPVVRRVAPGASAAPDPVGGLVARAPSRPAPVRHRVMGIWDALQWAIRDEGARLELPGDHLDLARRPSYGMEHVMIERGRVGCAIDGGGYRRDTVPMDAEVLVAALSRLPNRLGGLRQALAVAETARSGLIPDAMVGVVPRCVPRDWKGGHRFGARKARSVVVDHAVVREWKRAGRAARWFERTVEVRMTPVTFEPSADHIAAARRIYRAWWHALLHVQKEVIAYGALERLTVTRQMPPGAPWMAAGPAIRKGLALGK
ncbi:hypothetical protein [Jannaschia sp. M317]|uniref:hypothetical protein n=1 Tax=Jannaschia sp. M317 TaxID=2867011 RepID=UPI0021A78FA2|nr:hypothetical protein [Jannaschia sp. M317]UWQ16144.1 hypothetical protein K3551_09350 [Jannaschia sp. M317]